MQSCVTAFVPVNQRQLVSDLHSKFSVFTMLLIPVLLSECFRHLCMGGGEPNQPVTFVVRLWRHSPIAYVLLGIYC